MGSICELFMNTWTISFSNFFLNIYCSWLLYICNLKDLQGKQSHSKIHAYSLSIFNDVIRYSWILWRIFANGNNIRQITIFANRNNINEMKLWQIGIGINSWPKYQQIDSWRIYSQTIRELFANSKLFAEHCSLLSIGSDKITERLQMLLIYPQCGHKEGGKFPNFWWDNHQGKSSHI